MAAPIITPIPTPPIRSDAPADFAAKADAFAASLPGFVTETNASVAFMDQRAIDADASATAAAGSEQAVEADRLEVATNTATVASNTATVVTRANEVATNTQQVAANTQQVAADAQAVADALASVADGPVASVAGKSGAVTISDLSAAGVATQDGLETLNNKTINSTRYTVASLATTQVLDLAVSQVFTVDATVPRTLAFSNAPGADRAMTVVIRISGTSAVVLPANIQWSGGTMPDLGETMTVIVLFWSGAEWIGSVVAI